jgi:hypothetical protein
MGLGNGTNFGLSKNTDPQIERVSTWNAGQYLLLKMHHNFGIFIILMIGIKLFLIRNNKTLWLPAKIL